MRKLLFSLALLAGIACAQSTPNCQFTVSFTSNSPQSPAFSNKPTTSGGGPACVAWMVAYWTNSASSVSVQIEGAPDVAGSPGSYTALTAATSPITSANPATGTTSGAILACCDSYPWIRINPTTLSGTGVTMTVRVYGYISPTQVAGGGGGGGSGLKCLDGDVDAGTGTCTDATVVGLDAVPFCTGFTPTNGQYLQYTTGSSPNPCYTAAASGGGSGGTGLTVYSGQVGISLSGTVFFPVGGGNNASATEANVETYQGSGGTVGPGFGARISAALGTGNSVVLTWRKNGSSQSVTCTITNPATTCSDTGDSFTFAAGDAIDIQAVFTGTIVATPIWVMAAPVSSSTAPSGHGTASFNVSGGAITNLVTTGCITGVSYTATGHYTVSVSACPANYLVFLTGEFTNVGDFATSVVAPIASYGSTSFSITVNTSTGLFDPPGMFVLVP